MFEKEALEYGYHQTLGISITEMKQNAYDWQRGAEFGYNEAKKNLICLTQEKAVFIIKILEAKQRELQALLKLYDTSLGLFNLCSEMNPKQAKEKSEIESQLLEIQTAINILSGKK